MKLNELWQKARDKLRPGRRTVVLLCINAGLLVLAAVLCGLFVWSSSASTSQRAARLWDNGAGERYAQISVFFDGAHMLEPEAAYDLSTEVSKLLRENSLEPPNDEARLFSEAYSGTAKVSVSAGLGQSEAMATGIGGDFFFFHGFELLHGSLIHRDDVLTDVVVIDDVLAWRLYGASNVVGFEITVGGKLCYVGGVVSRGDKWPDSVTYGELSRLFIPYDTLKAVAPQVGISCYEIVLPDPVTGFGRGIVESAVSVDPLYCEMIENSSRYSAFKLLSSLANFGKNVMQTKAIAFPYWENAARAAAGTSAMLLLAMLLALVFPAVCVLALITRAWRKRGALVRAVTEYYRNRQMEKWGKKHAAAKEEEPAEKEEVII